jgi:hypothetical protein
MSFEQKFNEVSSYFVPVANTTNFDNVVIDGSLTVTGGPTSLTGNLTVTGATALQSSLIVGGASTFGGVATFNNPVVIAPPNTLSLPSLTLGSLSTTNPPAINSGTMVIAGYRLIWGHGTITIPVSGQPAQDTITLSTPFTNSSGNFWAMATPNSQNLTPTVQILMMCNPLNNNTLQIRATSTGLGDAMPLQYAYLCIGQA